MKITIQLNPVTKKNSQQIIKVKNRYMIIPSKQYKKYEKEAKEFMPVLNDPICERVNVKCLYYMQTKRRVDLNNLLEATTDVLVKYKVLEDDNSNIVVSHDGSRVYYDKAYPRTEIYITKLC
jgi:Holliday junction resolvase RusA-like endonuclease